MRLKKVISGSALEGQRLYQHSRSARKPRLLEQLRQALRSRRHYSRRTDQTFCQWVKRFIYFHKVRHPARMAEPEISAFLTHLAVKERVATHLLEDGYGIRTAQELLGHNDVRSTRVYTHVFNRGGNGVCSPPDGLRSSPVNKVRRLQIRRR